MAGRVNGPFRVDRQKPLAPDELTQRPREVGEVQHDAPRPDERAVVLHLEAPLLLCTGHRVKGLVQSAAGGVEVRRGAAAASAW